MANAQESEYMHDAMFIYNKPKLNNKIHENQDYVLSSEVVKFAVDIIKSWGYRKIYRHGLDALPGSNILDEFFHSVKASRFTVVVLTRGFLDNCRKKYESHAAFFSLLDKNELKRFVVLYLDYDEQLMPDAFKTMNSLSFSTNWRNEKAEWEKLKTHFENITQPVQETGPDPFPVTQTNFGSQNSILNSRGNLQHPQAALPGLELQGASLILSTMRQMLPGARSTMRNTVGRMFKQSVNFVNNCDQSFI